MIYVDTSVALAYLFNEPHGPNESFWSEQLVASELLEYELTVRANARDLDLAPVREVLARLAKLPLNREVLARAREPFPIAVRTLDALHLASADYLRTHSQDVSIATFDQRMASAATAMKFSIADIRN